MSGCDTVADYQPPATQLILTIEPLIVMVDEALASIWPLALRDRLEPASIFVLTEDVSWISFASSLIVPLLAASVMSFSLVIVILFFAVSMTMLFFLLLSMISIVSLPASSLSVIVWPLRDLISRRLFFPSSFFAGGLSLPFHSTPTT